MSSSIPQPRNAWQLGLRSDVLRLVSQLTPLQRHLLARAGLPRWLQLPVPWEPHPGRQLAAAHALATSEYGLLEFVPTFLGAYRLTPRGELVAGICLLSGLLHALGDDDESDSWRVQ